MYVRLSYAVLARARRLSTAYINVAVPPTLSPSMSKTAGATAVAPRVETTYVLGCGTLSTSTWPPVSAPVIVTATSVVQQQRQQPLSHSSWLSSSPPHTALVVTSAHPRHPLPMSLARSPVWCAATTRSQRGYALGRSTLNFAADTFAATVTAAQEGTGPVAEVGNPNNTGQHGNDASSTTPAEVGTVGTVMLPDAMVFSFKGSPQDFEDSLSDAKVLVFFYKAVCEPCAAIRSRLIHAVTDHLPMEASQFIHGANGKKVATFPCESGVTLQQQQQQQLQQQQQQCHREGAGDAAAATTNGSTPATVAASKSESPQGERRDHKVFFAPTTDKSTMTSEDKESCEWVCRTLADVSKAYPHRVIFLTVDTNENPKLTALHDIRSLPTFIAYRNGRMAGRVEGANEEEVGKLVHTITSEEVDEAPAGKSKEVERTEGKVG